MVFFGTKHGRRDLVTLVLRADIPGKPDYFAEPASAPQKRWRRSSPFNGGFSADMVFTLCV
jgi:hypothetical protein